MAGEILNQFNSLLPTICTHSDLQVIVKRSGDVSQVWSKEDADSMWTEGEVLCGLQSLSTFNTSSYVGTPPHRRPTQPDFEETWEEGGSGEVFDEDFSDDHWSLTNHHHDHQVPPSCSPGGLLYDLQPGRGRHHRYPPTLQEINFS